MAKDDPCYNCAYAVNPTVEHCKGCDNYSGMSKEEIVNKLYTAHAKCYAVWTIASIRKDYDTMQDLQAAMNAIKAVIRDMEV